MEVKVRVSEGRGPAVILVPAFQPGDALIVLARQLARDRAVVIVDDGSGPEYRAVFEKAGWFAGVTILRHASNAGKGAALKTGMEFVLAHYPDAAGVVTSDADGQHHPEDVRDVAGRLMDRPDALVMGVRGFQGAVPLRSRAGNACTRVAMRVLVGQRISDTQTGLRGIPRSLMVRLLEISAPGYEFELEMLVAAKHLGVPVVEQPIRTIYETGNPTSHFKPLIDSARIYWVLLRFSIIALLSGALDNLLFLLFLHLGGGLFAAQAGARGISVLFNYAGVRRAAFHSGAPHRILLPQYLALVGANLALAYAGIRLMTSWLPVGVLLSKITIESLLFAINFFAQRHLVFTRHRGESRLASFHTLAPWGVAR